MQGEDDADGEHRQTDREGQDEDPPDLTQGEEVAIGLHTHPLRIADRASAGRTG
jgi:hypothetical protein